MHYDRQTIWQTLLQHIQTYFQSPKNNSQIMPVSHEKSARQFLTELMPLLKGFLEPVELTMSPAPAGQQPVVPTSSSAIVDEITPQNAKDCLLVLVHELQHIPRHSY